MKLKLKVGNTQHEQFTDNNIRCVVEELDDVDWLQVFDHDAIADLIMT